MKFYLIWLAKLVYFFTVLMAFHSCKPVIHSFNVTPAIITGDEKVRIDWDVDGKAFIEFNEHASVDSIQLLEYTLVVARGGNEVRQTVQVQKMKPAATIEIILSTNKREGEMVIASGENNNELWNGFEIVSVSSAAARDLIVTHAGKTVTIKKDGVPSPAFAGTPAAGEWTFKTMLTDAEKKDSTMIPEKLGIKAVIKQVTH